MSAAVASDCDGEQSVTVRTQMASSSRGSPRGTPSLSAIRNSIYGTLAEERYRVHEDGRFELVEIAAEQLAVLEEYYAVPGRPARRRRGTDWPTWWSRTQRVLPSSRS